ncbi:hypothetical protein D3C76_1401010 [compost metagenome]
MDGCKVLRRVIDERAQAFFLPKRADASYQVTRGALRGRRVGHFALLHASGMGQRLEVQRADHRHHRHQQLALLAARQQGLEHLLRVEPELFRRLQAIGRRLGVMFVTVHPMLGAVLLQQV